MIDGEDDNAQRTIAEVETLSGTRGNWEQTWEQIAERILPSYASQFAGQNRIDQMPGTQRMAEMVDATGAMALTRFSAAMESMLTPRNSTWHHLVPSDSVLLKDRATRLWFENLTKQLFKYRYAPNANYASQKHEDYMMLGAFGTGNLFIDALKSKTERGIRYRAVHLGQTYFTENHQGLIRTCYRKFSYTAEQAIDHFGAEALPEIIRKTAAEPKGKSKIFWFIHKVKERPDWDPERVDAKGMPFYSCYVSVTGKKTVQENGYHSFPYSISRYVVAPGEVYGRSPAMMALPSLKTLNEMKKTVLKQGHRVVDPVLLAHDDGIVDSFSMRPGAVNAGGVNEDGRPLVHVLPTGNIAVCKELMDDERQVINDLFLVSLFQILVDTPQMTATEVIERAREKGALLSPTMGRQQSESLGPQIEREIDVLRQLRILEPMPPALLEAQGEYSIQYDSPLSRMARAEEISGLMQNLQFHAEIVKMTGNPEPLDWYNWDEIVPEMNNLRAVPTRWTKTMQQVQAIRQGRAQQAQMQQMIEAAPAASNMMKTLMPKQPAANA